MIDAAEKLFLDREAAHPRAFWLDGAGGRDWSGRRSILGFLDDGDPSLTFDARRGVVERHAGGRTEVVGEDIFEALGEEMARHGSAVPLWVGYFGYASRSDLPARTPAAGAAPDAIWMACRHPVIVPAAPAAPNPRQGSAASRFFPAGAPELDEYTRWFEQVQEHLRSGNSYEVNLTYRVAAASRQDPVATYLRLRESNPAPYAGLLRHGATSLLAASPERFITISAERDIETRPIKGTTPRGLTPAEDLELRRQLASDPRFRAENLMIVDLQRNDLSTVCDPGTVVVPQLMSVEAYPHVHQLVSTVRGHLRHDVGVVDAVRALFPPGSMTGAPKRRTMEVIAAVEATPRGVYSGAFGWLGADGTADLGVVIRSTVATSTAGGFSYEVGTGGGVTVWSDAESEHDETLWKLAASAGAVPEFFDA